MDAFFTLIGASLFGRLYASLCASVCVPPLPDASMCVEIILPVADVIVGIYREGPVACSARWLTVGVCYRPVRYRDVAMDFSAFVHLYSLFALMDLNLIVSIPTLVSGLNSARQICVKFEHAQFQCALILE